MRWDFDDFSSQPTFATSSHFPDLDAMVNIANINGRKVLGLDV
ncbi:hypothetical protein ACLSZ7_06880 [Avibacterium gallinarum]